MRSKRLFFLTILFIVTISNVFSKPRNVKKPFVNRTEEFQMGYTFKEHYFQGNENPSVALLEDDRLQVSAYDHGEKISRRLDITYKLVDDESGVVTYVALEGDCRFGSEGCSPRNFHITVVLKDYRYAIDNIERSHQVTLDIYDGCYLGDSSFASQRYRKIASMGGYPNLSMSDFHEVFNEVIKKAPSEKLRSSNSFFKRDNIIVTLAGNNTMIIMWDEKNSIQEETSFIGILTIEAKRVRENGSVVYLGRRNYNNEERVLSVSIIDNRNQIPYQGYMFEILITEEKHFEGVSEVHLVNR